MSQWAEIRHLHLVESVPKKEIARRLKLESPQTSVGRGGASSMPPQHRNSIAVSAPAE